MATSIIDQITKFLKSFKLDALGIMKLYIFVQDLLNALKGLSNAERKMRLEMATGYLGAAHILRAWHDDPRYANFRAGLPPSEIKALTDLADYAQFAAAALFGQ